MKIENNMTMKMKLNPENSCLEAQEKFWRGRFKEINEKFAKERQKMEILIAQISADNERLKSELNEFSIGISKCSVSVQTTVPVNKESNDICGCCQRPVVKTRTIFSKDRGNSNENIKEDNESEFFIDSDLVLRENTTVKDHSDNEDEKIDIQKTIKKLFSSNDTSNSTNMTSKLLELYEKRSKSVPDLLYDEADYDDLHQFENKFILQVDSNHAQEKILEENEIISDDSEKNPILNKTIHQNVESSKESRSRRRFLPAVKNIRKKVFKNFSKIKKICTNIKMTDSNDNTTSSIISNDSKNDSSNLKSRSVREAKNEELEQIQASAQCPLISAMKKSKSTGNIVKKVAFSDDLPSTKTVSESNLFQVHDCRFRRQPDAKPLLIGSVQVHRDKFARPIPAPRSKKNIVMMNNF